MKHALEKIVSFGRTLFDAPPTMVGSNAVHLEVDYKVILMSQYVSQRVIELSGKPLEIAFMYGGNVSRQPQNNQSNKESLTQRYTQPQRNAQLEKTTLDLNDFYVPEKQKITESAFFTKAESAYEANRYFANQQKRIVGIGHSHASFDVFHSATDYDNYKNLVGNIGVKVSHTQPPYQNQSAKKYSSFSRRLGTTFYVNKPQKTDLSFSYILPSLVFNAEGKNLDSVIATKTYTECDGQLNTKFEVLDCNIRVYNKQATLTDTDKKMLDFAILKVLSYNKIPCMQRINEPVNPSYSITAHNKGDENINAS